MAGILVLLLAVALPLYAGEAEGPYERARALYEQGPSRAPEIIALLEEHLDQHPRHEKSIRLLGITYFGVGKAAEALQQFDTAIAIAGERDEIVPGLLFYRARALFVLDRCSEARSLLDSHWAFWQDGARLQKQYEAFYPDVIEQCPESTDPTSAVEMAMGAVHAVRSQGGKATAGDVLVVLRARGFARMSNDGDLGPFVKAAAARGDRAVVVVVPEVMDGRSLYGVYFHTTKPTAMAEFSTSSTAEARHSAASRAIPVSAVPIRGKLRLEDGSVLADDGTPLDAFRITEE